MAQIASIIILGILAQYTAWKVKVPAILPLILIGLLVGPLSVYWNEGEVWMKPIFDAASNEGLFPGQSLFYFVSLSIGIILFEGGLTLKLSEIREVGPSIVKLISLGSIVTFVLAGVAAHYIMGLSLSISFLFSALIIVTGPTVIAPILQNVPLNKSVSTVLKWEGILIDPIGATAAVLMYEFIQSSGGSVEFTSHAFKEFLSIILVGSALGTFSALFLRYLLKKDLIPHFLLNVFTLALVLFVFVLSDFLAHESGLLTVVVMGTVLANLDVPRLSEILYFKESLSVLLISILFILLAANISIEDLQLLLDPRCLILFLIVILVVRPLGVFLSTRKSNLNINEKLFISWVGPRGIVAAGIASLFGLKLANDGVPNAEYITPLVFMVVLGTVLLNATTAKIFAKMLRVIQTGSDGILIVGANKAAILIAQYLKANNRDVIMLDNSPSNVTNAKSNGLEALEANIYKDNMEDNIQLLDIGYLVAMTGSDEVNSFAIKEYKRIFGEKGAYRLISQKEMKGEEEAPEYLISYKDDYLNINEAARDYPEIQEIEIGEDPSVFFEMLDKINSMPKSIPLFTKSKDGTLENIPVNKSEINIEDCEKLVYLGEKIK